MIWIEKTMIEISKLLQRAMFGERLHNTEATHEFQQEIVDGNSRYL